MRVINNCSLVLTKANLLCKFFSQVFFDLYFKWELKYLRRNIEKLKRLFKDHHKGITVKKNKIRDQRTGSHGSQILLEE